jgi:hypothetical protein
VPSSANGGQIIGYAAAEITFSGAGGISHPAITLPGTAQTSAARTLCTTSAAISQIAGVFNGNPALRSVTCRSGTAGAGGWFSENRLGMPGSIANGSFVFGGLASAYGLADCFGAGWFFGDPSGVFLKSRTGMTTTSIPLDGTLPNPLGGVFPALTRALVQTGRIAVYTCALPGVLGWVGIRVVDEATGIVYAETRLEAATANLPTADLGLGQDTEAGTGTQAAVVTLADFGRDIWVQPGMLEAA